MQAFAMKTILQDLGKNPKILNYRGENYTIIDAIKTKIKSLLNNLRGINKYYPFVEFQDKYLNQTKVLWNRKDLNKYASRYEAIVCGSDQIWAPNVFNSIYMLDFLTDHSVKKISYAASVGLLEIPEELVEVYKRLLTDFDSISVREKSGSDLLEKRTQIKSEVVLDPTLMLDTDKYNHIEKKPRIHIPEKYIFCYFLNEENNYQDAVRVLNQGGYTVIGISRDIKNKSWMSFIDNIGPSEFVWLIHNAEKVITDSYHGTIFSILYEKDFYTFERFKIDDIENQNSRIFQLKSYFLLDKRIVKADDVENDVKPIDYKVIYEKLEELRKNSKKFLEKSLDE